MLAYGLFYLFRMVVGTVFVTANLVSDQNDYAPGSMLMLELVPFLAMVATGALMAMIEHRRILDYNLNGPRRPRQSTHFAAGLCVGMVTFSALIGALKLGGWLRFGPPALAGAEMVRMAALWGCAFLLVACVEEGMFRCYLQFTLTRGINFWWALAVVGGIAFTWRCAHEEMAFGACMPARCWDWSPASCCT